MLASITPLGERSRGFSWGLTASAFAAGAVGAGALGGAIGGALGSLAPSGTWRDGVAIGVLAAALVIDATPLRRRLPTTRRQVNEDWMRRYRGWVYGLAFGAQLGTGVSTIVTSAAVYAMVLGTLLSGTVGAGAVVGAAFGVVRALSVLPARAVTDPASLTRLHARLEHAEPPACALSLVAEAAAIALVLVGLV
jgi:MFS family permease